MSAIASYLRHLIVAGILIAIDKLGLPAEGADEFAETVSLFVVGTASWWLVKYVLPKIKKPSKN